MSSPTLTAYNDVNSARRAARALNTPESLKASRLAFASLIKTSKVKSDLKKSAALMKKLKATLCLKDCDTILKDIESFNLSRYLEEIATSLIESKLKLSEHAVAAAVIQSLHQKYTDFLPPLLLRYMDILKSKDTTFKDDPREAQRVRRTTARIYLDLLAMGVTDEVRPIVKYLKAVAGKPEGGGVYQVVDAQAVVGFAKTAGPDVLGGMVPRTVMAAAESTPLPPNDPIVSPEVAATLLAHLTGALATLTQTAIDTHLRYHKMKQRIEKDRLLAGKLPEEREKVSTRRPNRRQAPRSPPYPHCTSPFVHTCAWLAGVDRRREPPREPRQDVRVSHGLVELAQRHTNSGGGGGGDGEEGVGVVGEGKVQI